MEGSKAAGVGGGGDGEVRKVHIVYFLSHNGGKTEQPHLLRVHHLHRNRVHLRDVKRWMSDVRGKDMPDSYAWSYKRRYKSGYIWQDLRDDDLITPLSDNEYVLKGSEISSKNNDSPLPLETSAVEEEAITQVLPTPKTRPARRSLLRLKVDCEGASPKAAPSPPDQESPGTTIRPPRPSVSDASDESAVEQRAAAAADVRIDNDVWKQMQEEDRHDHYKLRAEARHHRRSESGGGGGSWWPGQKTTSSLLRNLLTCGTVETSNSSLQPLLQRSNSKKDHVPIDTKTTTTNYNSSYNN